jgi:hypothetical protein
MTTRGRPKGSKKKKDEEPKDKDYINKKLGSISNLQDEINSMLSEIDTLPQDLVPPKDLLPGLDFEYTKHDYERDMETIKEDAKETLECISSLYLKDEEMSRRSVRSIIKLDAETISDIKFSLSCAKMALINAMKQIDAGANDPDMHVAVSTHNKEIRESSMKMSELLSKMKAFYKELRDEYEHKEINEQQKLEDTKNPQEQIEAKPNDLVIFDQRKWNKIIDEFKKDPTLLDGKAFGTAGT